MRREAELDQAPRTTFQGMPPLGDGLLDGEGSGELFPQPVVRDSDGDLRLMDDVVGNGITIVALAPAARRLTANGLSVTVVAVGDDSGTQLQADSQDLAAWFNDRAVTVAVLRPDRYVYAVSDDVEYALTATKRLSDELFGTQAITAQ
jgi:3-(3-hydroxy-phenyl)propionate hydroxylase